MADNSRHIVPTISWPVLGYLAPTERIQNDTDSERSATDDETDSSDAESEKSSVTINPGDFEIYTEENDMLAEDNVLLKEDLSALTKRLPEVDDTLSDEESECSTGSDDHNLLGTDEYPVLDYNASLNRNMGILLHRLWSDDVVRGGQDLSNGRSSAGQRPGLEDPVCSPGYDAQMAEAASDQQVHSPSLSLDSCLTGIRMARLPIHEKDGLAIELRRDLKDAQQELYAILEKVAILSRDISDIEMEATRAKVRCLSFFKEFGISYQLYHAYESFCKSLDPKFGGYGGFSAVTSADHDGDYIQYDPDFEIFKECVEGELPYTAYNFRVEASSTRYVEFWPLKVIEQSDEDGEHKTWGEKYSQLYQLAVAEAQKGDYFNADADYTPNNAMEMLLRLPLRNDPLTGGYLFEYRPDSLNAKHPIKAMRWKFHSAHKIDSPVTREEKILRLLSHRGKMSREEMSMHEARLRQQDTLRQQAMSEEEMSVDISGEEMDLETDE